MAELSFSEALARAERRLCSKPADRLHRTRRGRSDRGLGRLAPEVERKIDELLATHERPVLTQVRHELETWCREHGHPTPSRATLYNAIERLTPPAYAVAELPESVRVTLHNVGGPRVPGHQIVFAAFNYGDTRALSYAASLPWICLERAAKMRGFRPKSRALLVAIARCRGIPA